MKEKRKNNFVRNAAYLKPRRLVLVIAEGAVTERQYIDVVENILKAKRSEKSGEKSYAKVVVIKHGDNGSPKHLLGCLRKEINDTLDRNYSAWLICDRDQWTREQFEEVRKWVDKDPKRNHWILSAPNFEYWLSLHFDSSEDWRRYLKDYDKKIRPSDFSIRQIAMASKRARRQFQNNPDLFTNDGSQMFEFVEYLANEYGLDLDDFNETP